MEQIIIPEQDIINAICLFQARNKNVMPEDVEVELAYDDDEGFSAESFIRGQVEAISEAGLIAAVRLWISEFLNRDPFASGIELVLDDEEGIIAVVN
ncbi:DUF2653 family protein [Viridibacillus sp. FSL R5-0477]|uniref:DUF2653 family protein n=1 Tax=Viridibacillus arenosi FSL R5-213 TaxID=1227360 RepID=W4F6B2_9BACL|nr:MULTISPECIES: DUF2653 family protein [Viridibacillus]ETT87907.1 hypothetical protein C176_03153 [Viridibacillus arenosi FSL R5-213]OMC81644.1 hypothetical protein BK130_13310 [Viridibacillus sp. FSL H8-0123]OMC87539.1 hypothetical protein BK137_20490 [Viridibacillus arenosi]OMC89185.1 hypothetical protein BK128_04460 [Viridibacillus sp. FSL H7-0596]